jgi:hypothetical protein
VRLHRNQEGYHGERVRMPELLASFDHAARTNGWVLEVLTQQGGAPVLRLLRSPVKSVTPPRRCYISAGLHGDEPAGPLAALELVRQDRWPQDAQIVLFPCLNPDGIRKNRREGPEDIDLNRDYRDPRTDLVKAHMRWLQAQPGFDVALLLHEDWEADGFYLYELCRAPAPSLAGRIIGDVAAVCPILQADQADGWRAERGIVRPQADPAGRPEWPEALYLFQERTDRCYTFEAPSDYPMSTRVSALVTAVQAALRGGGA